MYEDLLVDGVSISSSARIVEVWDGVQSTPSLRGSRVVIPGVDGETPVARPFDVGVLQVGLAVLGVDGSGEVPAGDAGITRWNDAWRALRRLCPPGKAVTLERRLSYTTGNEAHEAQAEYLSGLEPSLLAGRASKITLALSILSGLWYATADTVVAAGTHTIAGDVRTRRMTVTFTGGTNPSLTNSTTGDVLTWTGTVGATPVVVDVEAMTATQGASDVSSGLEWSGSFPMTLDPTEGDNVLAVAGGGTVSVAYRAAYL